MAFSAAESYIQKNGGSPIGLPFFCLRLHGDYNIFFGCLSRIIKRITSSEHQMLPLYRGNPQILVRFQNLCGLYDNCRKKASLYVSLNATTSKNAPKKSNNVVFCCIFLWKPRKSHDPLIRFVSPYTKCLRYMPSMWCACGIRSAKAKSPKA